MEKEPREVLTLFGEAFLTMLENSVARAMFKMMLGEATRKPGVAAMFNKVGPGRGFSFMNRYLEHQMDLGRLRRMDPGAATRCFIGPLVAYVITSEIFVQMDSTSLRPEQMVSTTIDIFLDGMAVGGRSEK
jgi:TetR/AcrR family transcriptional regulator, mexJK operon transcriptional repressor